MLVFLLVLAVDACCRCRHGFTKLATLPLHERTSIRGYIALAVIALWASRRHLIAVIRKVFGGAEDLDDLNEPMRYRTAVLGLIGVMVFLICFCYRGGATVLITVSFFILYYAISIAITRMRAELGTPVHDLHYSGPDEILTRTIGTRKLGRGNLVMFSMFWFINRAYRSHPMPHQLEGFKMAERTRMNLRHLAFALMFAALLGSLSGFWALIDRGYRLGMETRAFWPSLSAFGIEPYRRLDRWLTTPTDTLIAESGFMICGFIIASFLMLFRMRFVWWAPPSRRICYLDELGNERDMELPFCKLAHQVATVATWWNWAASPCCPFLLGAYSR